MENIKISKEKLMKMKDWIIFILLFFWMVLPILQTFRWVYKVLYLRKSYFYFMRIIGGTGIGLSVFTIYDKIRKSDNKKKTIKELIPIGVFTLYMIWTLISCIFSPDRYRAFHGNYYRQEGYFMYLNYAGYFLCAFLLENKKLRKILLNTFIIASLFLIMVTGVSLISETCNEFFMNNDIDKAVFAQFNHYGYYLMMSLMCSAMLFITEKNKILKVLYLISFTIIGAWLIYNNTFGCYLATSIVLILYVIYSLIL